MPADATPGSACPARAVGPAGTSFRGHEVLDALLVFRLARRLYRLRGHGDDRCFLDQAHAYSSWMVASRAKVRLARSLSTPSRARIRAVRQLRVTQDDGLEDLVDATHQ